MTSGNGIILGDAIIYLRMSDFRDEDGMTFTERAEQLRLRGRAGHPCRPYPGGDRERRRQRGVPARVGV
jgi:hypothetical protein